MAITVDSAECPHKTSEGMGVGTTLVPVLAATVDMSASAMLVRTAPMRMGTQRNGGAVVAGRPTAHGETRHIRARSAGIATG